MSCPDRHGLERLYANALIRIRVLQCRIGTARLRLSGMRARLALSARWRRRVALAVGIGALLVSGTAEHVPPPVALVEAPVPHGEALADVYSGPLLVLGVGHQMPRRKEDMPKTWRRTPCPEGEGVRIVQGVCFDLLTPKPKGNPPECSRGIPWQGECLMPMPAGDRVPSTLRR